ncbi:MAG: hypothetical protein KKE02_06335 [Alphaproteobacteria bacterium]|nr:hypothetical protein [Alphaproteobacteria bacterium]MBU1513114.1 hypothetical protein [Alphaproteobacteria bacterium]MBU2095222.1 hypothetical protein [Alphaproteobacteria bacterium]MBU2150619.1 hypothetical protein [Alphaproteobacteria bacterium]MBU2306122.1 hypothetical protein [Alphaproteobacteria bacterium]
MRSVTYLAIAAVLAPAPALLPSVTLAQGQSPTDACSREISYAVQDRYPQARGVKVTSSNVSDGRNEARVMGKGEFDDRNGGESKFSYGCTYNYRTGRTSNLDVSDLAPKSKDNSAAIAGLVLGAIVIGAIAASSKDKDRDRDDWNHHDVWSPADGVRCVSRERACYKNGRYSDKWTQRIFYR